MTAVLAALCITKPYPRYQGITDTTVACLQNMCAWPVKMWVSHRFMATSLGCKPWTQLAPAGGQNDTQWTG